MIDTQVDGDLDRARDRELDWLGTLDEALEALQQGEMELTPGKRLLQSLASDLHDGAVQELFTAELDAAELIASQALDPAAAVIARRLYRRIQGASRELRAVMHDMSVGERPGLANVALDRAIHEYIDSFTMRHAITVDVVMRGPEVEVGLTQREAAVRLVREGLANIGKHAKASQVLVSVYRSEQWFTVNVDDDGVGDPVRIRCAVAGRSSEAFGLTSLSAQVYVAGGRMWVSSAPTLGGVRISLALPSQEL